MGLREKLGLSGCEPLGIDWDITPADTFGIFESWGGKVRVRSKAERYYYFYIDGWETPARLFLMERGVKFARTLARIDAPQEMIDTCMAGQGKGLLDKNYAIDDALRGWLQAQIVDAGDLSKVIPEARVSEEESLETGLPGKEGPHPDIGRLTLRSRPAIISEQAVPDIVRQGGFFDSRRNPTGGLDNALVDNGDSLTVTDRKTGIMWQRNGCDITTIRKVREYAAELNRREFAGHADWRLPTMEEALSLMEPERNDKGLYLHPCFSREQPFIFLADQRKPGGYWFIDYKQGTVFWASGSIPGGFGRVCRSS